MAIYDFTIAQREGGYGEFSFTFTPPKWIKEPVIEAEIDFSAIFCGVEFKLDRPVGKGTTVSAMYGANPRNILIDLETQMPVLPFYKVKIKQ